MSTIGLILVAGKGTRVAKFTDTPKALLPLNGKPLAKYALDLMESFDILPVIIVSHKKDEIIQTLGNQYIYTEQEGRPGTGGALYFGVSGILENQDKLPSNIESVLVLQGDDTAFLKKETIKNLLNKHENNNAKLTLLTTIKENPTMFGRIVRDENSKFMKIVEEKNASAEERKIKEINTGVCVYDFEWLKENVNNIQENDVTQEYYATDLVNIAYKNIEVIETSTCDESEFFGINNEQQYREAIEKLK